MNQTATKDLPFVSICTPTFNRRPFMEMTIACFMNQTYPREKMEWIILDDGTDKIGDLVSHIKEVNYIPVKDQIPLGKKRNMMHDKARGDFIVYMDDDDYYPPDRVMHAITMLLKNPTYLIAGSSQMFIYFNHIQKMYSFGPYGPNHSTAATFAFRKALLQQTRYDDECAVTEERAFLKGYQIPLLQLDPMKCILVFSHSHNSVDKKLLLVPPLLNPKVKESPLKLTDFIKEPEWVDFFTKKMEPLLNSYEAGKPDKKPEVMKQIQEGNWKREKILLETTLRNEYETKIKAMQTRIQELIKENLLLKEKWEYFEREGRKN